MSKINIEEIDHLINNDEWEYTEDSEIPYTKQSLIHFRAFLSHLSGLAEDTIEFSSNGFGGICAKYKSHCKKDDRNLIIKIIIDFGDNSFSFCYIQNERLINKGSFLPYSELLNVVPLS